jgi:hypothetical protein
LKPFGFGEGQPHHLFGTLEDNNVFIKKGGNTVKLFGDQKMTKSKKDKVAGLEKHKQLQREKEMKRKQKKQVSLPTKHTKKK